MTIHTRFARRPLVVALSLLPLFSITSFSAGREEHDFVIDSIHRSARTGLLHQCIRTGLPDAGAPVPDCSGAKPEEKAAALPPKSSLPPPVAPPPARPAAAQAAPQAQSAPKALQEPESARARAAPVQAAPEPAHPAPQTAPQAAAVAPETAPQATAPAAEPEAAPSIAEEEPESEPAPLTAEEEGEPETEPQAAVAVPEPAPPTAQERGVPEAPPQHAKEELPPRGDAVSDSRLNPNVEAEQSAAAQAATNAQSLAQSIQHLTLSTETDFDFDKAVLRPAGRVKLEAFATKLRTLDYETVYVEGHTDRIGTVVVNRPLSVRRAITVKDYLVSEQIDESRIVTKGVGSTKPVTKPQDCKGLKNKALIACLQPDRRVEVDVRAASRTTRQQ